MRGMVQEILDTMRIRFMVKLCVKITFFNSWQADDMAYGITLQPGNHNFPAETSETILDAALKHGHTIPFSCRDGVCGMCKGRVVQGSVDHGKVTDSMLNAAERAAGMALFCCAKPKSNLVIERPTGIPAFAMPTFNMPVDRDIPEVMDIPTRTISCRVEKMEKMSDDVILLCLKLPAKETMQFLAGQHINILTEDGRQLKFPLANAPHDNKFLQLHIRNIPGSAFTQHVFTKMKKRDTVRISEAFGTFHLRKGSKKPIIFVASGTGIAAVKAIIEHSLHARMDIPMHVYWGARNRAEIYLPDFAKQLQALGIFLTVVLSEPLAEDLWRGKTGLAHQAVAENYSDLSGHRAYVCGSPSMVESAKRDFTTRLGLPVDEFFSGSFSLT